MEPLDGVSKNIRSVDFPDKIYASDYTQVVKFTGNDDQHTEQLTCRNVTLIPSPGEHERCSSQINLKSRVDYSWEHRFYTGQLLAVHVGGKYLAYGLRAVGQNNGNVRIVNRDTNERALVKGMNGLVQDISFAHLELQVLLAVVDEKGNLFVYEIIEDNDKTLNCNLILHVKHDIKPDPGCNHRIIWVPYMPDELEAESKDYSHNAKLLALTLGTKAELWQIGTVIERYGLGPHNPETLDEGLLLIQEHSKSIVDATFSPEGTALATVSLDGSIKFFQVYMQQRQTPRCLHNWKPHDGKPLSSIFFLDNHKYHNPDSQFWKFVITGAENNTELKVWGCVDWTCLQTIKFSRPEGKNGEMFLKAGLDLSARHLLLSDIYNRVIYLLRIHVDDKETCAYICSASEFLLPFPILSFGVVDAGTKQYKTNSYGIDNDGVLLDDDEMEDPDEDDDVQEAVVVLMYLVQPKSMQECCIKFIPPVGGSGLNLSTIVPNSLDKTEIKSCPSTSDLSKTQLFENISTLAYKPVLNLMTPDEFSTSPGKKDTDEVKTSKENISIRNEEYSSFPRDILVSGGSSPSREVQEILSLQSNTSGLNLVDLISSQPPQRPYFKDTDIGQLVDLDVKSVEGTSVKASEVSKQNTIQSNGWPHIPLLPEVLKPSEDSSCHINKRSSLDMSESLSENIRDPSVWKSSQRLEITMSTVLATVQEQQAHIMGLRQEIAQLRSRQADTVMMAMFEKALDQHAVILEEQLLLRETKERERQENLMSVVSQAVGNLVTAKLEDIVSSEIKENILPAIINEIEPLKHQLHMEMTQKLSTTDHLLKENISKLVHSKSVMDILSLSLASTIKPSIAETCKDLFNTLILPRCEKALENIFLQFHDSLTQGTREYFQQLHKELDKLRLQTKKGMETLSQIETIHHDVRDRLSSSFQQEFQTQLHKGMNSLQDSMVKQLRDTVKDIIGKEFRTHKAVIEDSVLSVVRSRAVTPAPHFVDQIQLTQAHIIQLINNDQINAAFQQALSASDLNLVTFTCEKVDPEIFHRDPCPLQQPVLLSLIQQLSADLNNVSGVKLRYLEEAIVQLDKNNTMTKEHLPAVLSNLHKQLNLYMVNNPTSRNARKFRMLSMLSDSVLMK